MIEHICTTCHKRIRPGARGKGFCHCEDTVVDGLSGINIDDSTAEPVTYKLKRAQWPITRS